MGDKKDKRKHEEAESEVNASGDVDEEEARRRRKKEKKRAKREREEQERLASIAGAVLSEDNPVDGDAVVEAQRKDKKKKTTKDKQNDDGDYVTADEGYQVVKSSKAAAAVTHFNNYKEAKETLSLSDSAVESYRKEVDIEVFPPEAGSTFKPILSFEYLNPSLLDFVPHVKKYIADKKFTKPSPIQSQCWPPLLAGDDIIGIASTGSGKTLTFLVPALLRIAKAGPQPKTAIPSPRVLVLAPTRELAMQSHQVVMDIGGPKGVCIYGGVPKPQQKADLRGGADVVVATPGRLIDLLEEGALSLSNILYMVLDEADRMLDDGFEPAIRQILSKCPPAGSDSKSRQTAMFSATWPEEIRALADKFLRRDVIRVTVGGDELSANHRVTQIVECVEAHQKDKKLMGLLEKYHKSRKNKVLVFVLYKKEAVELQSKISSRGWNVTAIHGDKSQHDRTAALEEFKSGKTPLLIATDVAARGLDIPQVEYVINYSFPLTVEDYVHRIGRTGRGGATGTSHTFFTDFDKGLAGALVAVLQEAKQEVPQEIYKYPLVTKRKDSKLYGAFGPKQDLAGLKAKKITFD